MKTWNAPRIKASKGRHKLVCLTAYDCATARLLDDAGFQLILVGDSLAMTLLGYETTLPATMEQMLHHTAAVSRGVTHALVVADMPFMSYQASIEQALVNAGRFMKEAGAGAVKIEGGAARVETVRQMVENGIPVLGHIGLTPQSVETFGGYKVQGRTPAEAARLVDDARKLVEAGVFGLVLECLPAALGAEITRAVAAPTIGIGAGPDCDGQILVLHDLLGLPGGATPRFARRYADLETTMRTAMAAYKADVETGRFPGPEHCYSSISENSSLPTPQSGQTQSAGSFSNEVPG